MFLSKLLGFGPPARPAVLLEAEGAFTKEELRRLHAQLTAAAGEGPQWPLTPQQLWATCHQPVCPAVLCGCFCRAVQQQLPNAPGPVPADAVVIAKAKCERLDKSSAQDFAFQVLAALSPGSDSIPRPVLEDLLLEVLQLALAQVQQQASCAEAAATSLAAGAMECCGGAGSLTHEGYVKWCRLVPAVHQLLISLLAAVGDPAVATTAAAPVGPDPASAAMPAATTSHHQQQELQQPGAGSIPRPAGSSWQCPKLGWGLCAPSDGLLQPEWVWVLSAGLPPDQRQEWRLLFNSTKHGASYNTFLGRVGEMGPTLLLIRDKGGHLFGGVAGSPWRKTGTFYGDHSNFIFSLLPTTMTYPASGINSNLQWCGQGFSQLPNGVGFGGQVGNYGVWLDANFETGMSRPVATFASPCLASDQTFQIDTVECWLLVPPEEEEGGPEAAPGSSSSSKVGKAGGGSSSSVLHKAKEDQKILELAGVAKNYSASVLGHEPLEE